MRLSPNLDVSVVNACVVTRERCGRRTVDRRTGFEFEAGSVPRTYQVTLVEPALRHRRPKVRASLADRVDLVTATDEHHRNAVEVNLPRLFLRQVNGRNDRYEVARLQAGFGAINADSMAIDQIAAEVTCRHRQKIARHGCPAAAGRHPPCPEAP